MEDANLSSDEIDALLQELDAVRSERNEFALGIVRKDQEIAYQQSQLDTLREKVYGLESENSLLRANQKSDPAQSPPSGWGSAADDWAGDLPF